MKYYLLALMIPVILFASAQEGKEQKSVQKYPKVGWRKKVKIAVKSMNNGSYESYYNAASYLEDAYKAKPDKIRIPHLLGEVNRQLRDYEAAEKYYSEVIKKDPEAYV